VDLARREHLRRARAGGRGDELDVHALLLEVAARLGDEVRCVEDCGHLRRLQERLAPCGSGAERERRGAADADLQDITPGESRHRCYSWKLTPSPRG
jgi:hypothetical protein